MEDDSPGGAFIDVFALCFLTQDLTVVCPHGFMRPLVDQCHAAYGVAHFLFHPSMSKIRSVNARSARRPPTPAASAWNGGPALRLTAGSATAGAYPSHRGDGASAPGNVCRIQAPDGLAEATLLFLLPTERNGDAPMLTLDGKAVPASIVERYGHRFAQITVDLCGEHVLGMAAGEG